MQALATTRVTIRPSGAMRDQAFVESSTGLSKKVQRTFSGRWGLSGRGGGVEWRLGWGMEAAHVLTREVKSWLHGQQGCTGSFGLEA